MKIGELARLAGVNASAIRYYEALCLLPAAARVGGQRRYAQDAANRVLLIRFAREMGFTLAEVKVFLDGLRETAPVGPRWRKLAIRKIKEVDAEIERGLRLKALLGHLLKCGCPSLGVCVQRLSLSPNLQSIARPRTAHRSGRGGFPASRSARRAD